MNIAVAGGTGTLGDAVVDATNTPGTGRRAAPLLATTARARIAPAMSFPITGGPTFGDWLRGADGPPTSAPAPRAGVAA